MISVHVNHNLQAAATSMEEVATGTANRLHVRSVVEKIPWETAPFPEQPGEGAAGEKIAREARHNRLFTAMQRVDAKMVAFAHHADDQVETAIMRMFHGSSPHGIAGMRPLRRWGMGHKDNDCFAFGEPGMRHWIVRPFLHIPKVHTCAFALWSRL